MHACTHTHTHTHTHTDLNILKEAASPVTLHVVAEGIGGDEDATRGQQLSNGLLDEGHVDRDSVASRSVHVLNGGSQLLRLDVCLLQKWQLQLTIEGGRNSNTEAFLFLKVKA